LGRNYRSIEQSAWPAGQILMAANQTELEEKIAKYKPAGTSLETFKGYTLLGTPKECLHGFQTYADLGANYYMLYFVDLPSVEGLRLFKEEGACLLG